MEASNVNQTDLNRILGHLNKIVSQGANYQKPLGAAAVLLTQEIKENFDRQGAIYQGGGFVRTGGGATTRSGTWKPLAPSTRDQRQSLGFNAARPILVRSSKLKNSFKVQRITKDELKIGTQIPWAQYHQTGGKNLPQRRLVGTSIKSKKAIALLLFNHIFGHIKQIRQWKLL